MNAYTVKYILDGYYSETKSVSFLAKNKFDAYEKAVFVLIPQQEHKIPYAAWVDNVTYQNGKVHHFNTFAGKPY